MTCAVYEIRLDYQKRLFQIFLITLGKKGNRKLTGKKKRFDSLLHIFKFFDGYWNKGKKK